MAVRNENVLVAKVRKVKFSRTAMFLVDFEGTDPPEEHLFPII